MPTFVNGVRFESMADMVRKATSDPAWAKQNNIHVNTVSHARNVVISGGVITVDGRQMTDLNSEYSEQPTVIVNIVGNVESVETENADVLVNGSVHEVNTHNGNINCGDVTGTVRSHNGTINCGTIGGDARTHNGSINHR